MKLKHLACLIYLFNLQILVSQENTSLCKCDLLIESETNDEKVAQVAKEIEDSFYNLSTEGFNTYFDSEAFLHIISEKLELDLNDSFTKGFISGIKDTGDKLALKIIDEINNGAYYNLVNYQYNVVEQAYYFTFRIYSEETGINYHDYKLCSNGTSIKVNDIYIYITGEHLSETLSRLFLVSKPSKKRFSRLFGLNSKGGLLKFIEAKEQAEKGNNKRAYELMAEIKGDMAKEKFILIMKGLFASNYDYKIYENILKEFAELYPNDPTLYLKQIDYYLLKEDYTKAIENLDKLIFETDDDFINLIKGNVYALKNDFTNAEKHYQYMTINYPDLIEGYIGYMISLNYQNRFEEILDIVKLLIDEKGYERTALLEFLEEKEPDGSNALEAFVTSKVYKKWKRKS